MNEKIVLYLIALIMEWEGFRSKPYRDVGRGVWTIGYGTTIYPDGKRVGPNDPEITREQGRQYALAFALLHYKVIVAMRKVMLSDRQVAALLDFSYNEGITALLGSTLWRQINTGTPNASDHFLEWNKAHDAEGKVIEIAGLEERRKAEKVVFDGTA